MFRKMRLISQQLADEEAVKILESGSHGVLSVNGDEGYPYGVPVSYAFKDGRIYVHGAKIGHKIESIKADPKVSFCVVDRDQVMPAEITTRFRSVICFGKAYVIEDENEIRAACEELGEKYLSEYRDEYHQAMEEQIKALGLVEITVEHMTGKQSEDPPTI